MAIATMISAESDESCAIVLLNVVVSRKRVMKGANYTLTEMALN